MSEDCACDLAPGISCRCWNAAKAKGAKEERAAIAAWLLEAEAEHIGISRLYPTIREKQEARADECRTRAEGILAGEHLKPEAGE